MLVLHTFFFSFVFILCEKFHVRLRFQLTISLLFLWRICIQFLALFYLTVPHSMDTLSLFTSPMSQPKTPSPWRYSWFLLTFCFCLMSAEEMASLTAYVLFVLQTHSNETIGNIRWKISEHLSCPVDNVQIFANDSVVSLNDHVSFFFFLLVCHFLINDFHLMHNKCFRAACCLLHLLCGLDILVSFFCSSSLLFFFTSLPSVVDDESRPEAADPAWLQWWAEFDCEELRYWYSFWQLRVLSLSLQQFQLCCLQLCLRLGAGIPSDVDVKLLNTEKTVDTLRSASVVMLWPCPSVCRRSPCRGWWWLWCATCLRCFTSWLT